MSGKKDLRYGARPQKSWSTPVAPLVLPTGGRPSKDCRPGESGCGFCGIFHAVAPKSTLLARSWHDQDGVEPRPSTKVMYRYRSVHDALQSKD